MAPFHHLIRFEAANSAGNFFADLGPDADDLPLPGTVITAYATIRDLESNQNSQTATIHRVGWQNAQVDGRILILYSC